MRHGLAAPAALLRLVSVFAILSALGSAVPALAYAVQNVLILTDNSSVDNVNGASHVSDLIAAFTHAPGAIVTTNSIELTNGSAMPLSVVTGWDAVIVVTVSGLKIDFGDALTLLGGINTHASDSFMFFTDACNGCNRESATLVLSVVNAVGGWSATLGNADNSTYIGTLTGAYSQPFTSLPTIQGTAYAPMLGVPAADVIYTTNSPSPGTSAAIVPGTADSVCVFMATDVTPFSVTGGIPQVQADGLATAYLNAALNCPPSHGPTNFLGVTKIGAGNVTKGPSQPSYTPGAVVVLRATPGPNSNFVGWSGDASGSANPLNVTMNTDKDIVATFVRTGGCRDCPTPISFPNPFNPITTIRYELKEPAIVSLSIYGPRGDRIATIVSNAMHPAGRFDQNWDGTDDHGTPVASGIYFYRLAVGSETVTRKIVLVK